MTSPPTARAAILLEHAAELARLLLKSSQPPRELASTFLHRQKRLDSVERQFISAAAHHALRVWRFARACALGEAGDVDLRPTVAEARAITAASILLSLHEYLPAHDAGEGTHLEATILAEAASAVLARECGAGAPTLLQRAEEWDQAAGDGDAAAIAIRWSLPDWVLNSWCEQHPPLPADAIVAMGRGFCAAAPLVLRVNRLRGDREHLLRILAAGGVAAAAHPLLPDAVVVAARQSLMESPWYEEGLFEVQDAGSQLVALSCGVRAGTEVLDACAGGGGKTIQLADIMRDRGSITACDIERHKLRGLAQRGARLSLGSIRTLALTPDGKAAFGGEAFTADTRFDCVLVDAPCSGFGTVRRHAALKWRLTEKTVLRLAERQAVLLARNASYVREGGTLVYATCSLLPQENSDNLRRFLAAHDDFSLDPLEPHFSEAGLRIPSLGDDVGELLLSPATLDSDGFYIARLRRSG